MQELTEQEQRIVALMAQEYSNKEIANKLFVEVSKLKNHISNIYYRLGLTGTPLQKRLAVIRMYHQNQKDVRTFR